MKVETLFKRSITYETKDDDNNLGEEAISFGKKHEFGDITWYPSQRQVSYRIDDRVLSNTSGNDVNKLFGFRSIASPVLVSNRKIGNLHLALSH